MYRFQRDSRLLKPADFGEVFNGTELRGSTSQILMLAKANDKSSSRLGFVLAKKHIKNAVDRNRIKRLVRESFRLNRSEFQSLDIVVLARSGAVDLSNQELRCMVDSMWFKLRRPTHGKSNKARNRSKR